MAASLKGLELPTFLPRSDLTATRAILKQLAETACEVTHLQQVDSGWDTDALMGLVHDLGASCPSRSIIIRESSTATSAADPLSLREAQIRRLSWPLRVSAPRCRKLASALLFGDSARDYVAVLEESPGADLQIRWSWGDPQRFVQRLASEMQLLWTADEGSPPPAQLPTPTDTASKSIRAPVLPTADDSSIVCEDPPAYGGSKRSKSWGIPGGLELRDYQKDAIRAWLAAGGRGILAMATGAGKTLTALCLACKVAEQNLPFVIIVVCPYLNLATQWQREVERFGIPVVPCFHGRAHWEQPLQDAYQRLTSGVSPVIAVVVSNATFLSETFRSALRPRVAQHLIIADEAHNLGALNLKTALPEEIQLRLALSATPERHGDPEGTQAIFDYFGNVVYEFGIARAIREGVLVPYRYYPVLVDLTPDEAETYRDLTAKIGRASAREGGDEPSDQLKMLLIKRARLLAAAANKLPALSRILREMDSPPEKAIVYCGDGSVESSHSAELERQIIAVSRLLGEEHGLRVRKFTCEESAEDREEILNLVRSGALNAVVAIRCLDEGIDVPDARIGFLLASSTNPRQFIQRRGRLLRRAPGKRRADIYDFIIRPPDFGGALEDDAFNLERRMFQRELTRIIEFCETAENGPLALQQLRDLRLGYNLLAH